MHSAGVDPAVVEIEQRAGRNCEVNGFVAAADSVERFHVFRCDSGRIMVDFFDETEQRFVFLVEPGVFEVAKNAPHQFFAAQQFRRNCGVGF